MSGISGSSIAGGVSNEIGVNTDVKYLLRISALSKISCWYKQLRPLSKMQHYNDPSFGSLYKTIIFL